MSASISLGTFRGIPIGVNWSVFLIAGLIAWSLATRILPAQVLGLDPPAYWAAGSLVAILFFASLLGHELAHAIVARREGLRVEGITLWLLGGVARMNGDAPSPGAEARISGVGPLTSFLFAVLFGIVAIGLGFAPSNEVVALAGAAAAWLAFVNLVLAVFNLLPGVPLDGGRLARAVLWRWRRDKALATRWATRLGQLLGYGLAGIGLVRVVFGDIGGLWFAILGFFLSSAAGAERMHSEVNSSLRGVLVADVMTKELPRVPGMLTVDTFIGAALSEDRSSTWLVSGPGGSVVGLLGLDHLRGLRSVDRTTARVESLAVPIGSLLVAYPDETLTDLLARLDRGQPSRAIQLAQLRGSGGDASTIGPDPSEGRVLP